MVFPFIILPSNVVFVIDSLHSISNCDRGLLMLVGISRIPFLLYHHFILIIILGVIVIQGQITFLNEPYFTTLEEESPIGTYLLTVAAIDLTPGSAIGTFSISSNEFAIDSSSGELSTVSVIDRESPATPLQFIFDVTYDSDNGELVPKQKTSMLRPAIPNLFQPWNPYRKCQTFCGPRLGTTSLGILWSFKRYVTQSS